MSLSKTKRMGRKTNCSSENFPILIIIFFFLLLCRNVDFSRSRSNLYLSNCFLMSRVFLTFYSLEFSFLGIFFHLCLVFAHVDRNISVKKQVLAKNQNNFVKILKIFKNIQFIFSALQTKNDFTGFFI